MCCDELVWRGEEVDIARQEDMGRRGRMGKPDGWNGGTVSLHVDIVRPGTRKYARRNKVERDGVAGGMASAIAV